MSSTTACHRCHHFVTTFNCGWYPGDPIELQMKCMKGLYLLDSAYDFKDTQVVCAALAHGDNCSKFEQFKE